MKRSKISSLKPSSERPKWNILMLVFMPSFAAQLSSWNLSLKVSWRDLTMLRIACSGPRCSTTAKRASKSSSTILLQWKLLLTTKISRKTFVVSTNCLETLSSAVTFTNIVYFLIQLYGRYLMASLVYLLTIKKINQ